MTTWFHAGGPGRRSPGESSFVLAVALLLVLAWPARVRAAAPALEATRLPDGRVTVMWPAAAADYGLEQSAALGAGAAWSGVAESPVTAGDRRVVTLPAAGAARYFRLRQTGGARVTVAGTLPAAGEAAVSVRRETVFLLTGPLAVDTVLGTNHLQAFAAGRRLLTRAELGGDRRRATLFCLEDLPGGTRVEVRFDGTGLTDALGRGVDLDGDGVAGGVRTVAFTTFNSAPLAGTAVIGRVLASEKGPGGTDLPLPGVTITVDGREQSLRTVTAADGTFRLQPAPAGRFFVNVDGRTSPLSAWPAGAYYPVIGKAWEAETGRTNNLAGGSGVIHLPLVAAGTLQPVSATEATRVTFPASVTNANPALAGVEITVPPNALFADSGTRGGLVGLAPVASDRLPEPLPGGLAHALDISIQTSGPQNFDVPVPAKFPNLPDPVTGRKLPPGAKTALWSFNHDTGRWEMQGPMTVTPDGSYVVTDPGVGIRQPGWHGAAPGSSGGGGPGGGGPPCGGSGGMLPEGTFGGGGTPCGCSDEPSENKQKLSECDFTVGQCGLQCFKQCGSAGGALSLLTVVKVAALCPAGAACSQDCESAGKDCKDFWQNCFLGGSRSLHGAEAVLAATGSAVDDAALLDNARLRDELAVITPLWAQLAAVVARAPTIAELTPADYAQALALATQLDALFGGRSPADWANARLDRLNQLILQSSYADSLFPPVAGWYVLEDLESGLVRRGRTGPRGYLNEIILRPNVPYRIRLLLGPTLVPHDASFVSADAGRTTRIPYGQPVALAPADADADGLPGEAEFILGTRDDRADTDGDGLPDRQELVNGTNPLDGQAPANGVVAALDTPGEAVDVAIQDAVALVADRDAGVAVVDLANPLQPVLLQQVNTPGDALAVALAGPRGAVADGGNGLVILDLATPASPVVQATLNLGGEARALAVDAGTAFVGLGNGQLVAVDLLAAAELSRVTLPGSPVIEDVAVRDGAAWVWAAGRLHAVEASAGPLVWRTSTASGRGGGELGRRMRLSLAGDLAYGAFPRGVALFNLTDPAAPVLVRLHDTPQFGWKQLLPAMADLGLAADGTSPLADEPQDLSLYRLGADGSELTYLGSFVTPGPIRALTFAGGLAFVADGQAGLQVVNFAPADTAGVPPTLTLRASFPLDPPRIESGQPGRLTALAVDDVLVRRVEFFRDGALVQQDLSLPFEYRFTAPDLAPGRTNLLLGVRAVDTAGNASALAELDIALLPDRTPPRVTALVPGEGSVSETVTLVLARFNEPLDPAGVTPARATLVNAGADLAFGTGDDTAVPGTAAYSAAARAATLELAAPLPPGRYRFTVRELADLAGNVLAAPAAASFWVAPGGPGGDPDGDGLSNEQEGAAGTSPFAEDTDGDGWADEVEVNDDRDPRDPASRPAQLYPARPSVEVRVESTAETAPGGPFLARPSVALIIVSAAEDAPPGPFVARPPVELIIASAAEEAPPGPFVARPSVELHVTPATEDAPAGPFPARPPVQVHVLPAAETAPAGPYLAHPPVTVKRN